MRLLSVEGESELKCGMTMVKFVVKSVVKSMVDALTCHHHPWIDMNLKLWLDGDSQLVLSRYMMIHGYGSRCAVHFANKQNSSEFQPHKQV